MLRVDSVIFILILLQAVNYVLPTSCNEKQKMLLIFIVVFNEPDQKFTLKILTYKDYNTRPQPEYSH
ncbi:MAG: hypothetical protein ACI8VC_000642 [Candidatus Endobugula sp.]|jgi:hypothetical protein